MSDRVHHYSLWVMPSGQVYEELYGLIQKLSRKMGVSSFEPHVTLLGGLEGTEAEILPQVSRLAQTIRPYGIELIRVEYLDEFYRCLFLRAAEGLYVMKANAQAREVFMRHDDPPYMPHLSLLYGDFRANAKQRLIGEIGSEWNVQFPVTSIHLYCSEGKSDEWYRVREFPLVASTGED